MNIKLEDREFEQLKRVNDVLLDTGDMLLKEGNSAGKLIIKCAEYYGGLTGQSTEDMRKEINGERR